MMVDDTPLPALPPAAALYGPESQDKGALRRFAEELRRRGWRIGGLVQEELKRPDGEKLGIDAIDIDTGRRIPIVRYTDVHLTQRICGLDTALLAEATAVLRRAVAAKVDLLVVEKFSVREKEGEGFSDEILQAMAEGIPTLVAVSLEAFDRWNAVTGGLGVLLPMDESAFWRWWGPHRLYHELAQEAGDGVARRVVVGRGFTLVEGPAGCGLARTPDGAVARDDDALVGQSLGTLSRLVHSWDTGEAAIGLAAINAAANRFDLSASAENGLDIAAAADGPVCVVGRFPGLAKRRDDWTVIEYDSEPGELPANAASWVLSGHEWAVVTASTLVDHSLPGLLAARGQCQIALVGPSTPLSARLHAYGIDVLSGFVVSDVEGCANAVAGGACFRELKPFGRLVSLRR